MKTFFMALTMCLFGLFAFAKPVAEKQAKPSRAPNTVNTKTMSCMTQGHQMNVDIRVEYRQRSALVTLVVSGNEGPAPTDERSFEASFGEAEDLLKGNAAMAFYDDVANGPLGQGRLLALRARNGYVAVPVDGKTMVYEIRNCSDRN